MKTRMITLAIMTALPALALAADRVEESSEWTETWAMNTENPTLEIHNIWGDVKVRPGPAGEITVSVREHRSAPTRELFERSLEVMPLDVQADSTGLLMRIGNWNQQWHRKDPCRGCRVEIQYDVQVPPRTQIDVGTVNDGKVSVTGIEGPVSASNVNGPVSVEQARSCDEVQSVNGEVRLNFLATPGSDCRIHTINGDIRVQVPDGAGLDVAMDLFNGRMVSEFPVDPMALPARVDHSESGGRHQYRIEQPAGVRIAGGGPVFTISSMNGDIKIQKTQ